MLMIDDGMFKFHWSFLEIVVCSQCQIDDRMFWVALIIDTIIDYDRGKQLLSRVSNCRASASRIRQWHKPGPGNIMFAIH
jgi:hypothetical protein